MGQTASAVSVSDISNSAITNVLMQSSSTCGANQSLTQQQFVGNVKSKNCPVCVSNVKQSAKLEQNFSCSSKQQNNADLVAKFKDKIDNDIKATTGPVSALVSSTQTANLNKVKNEMVNNINISDVSSCIADNLAVQIQEVGNFEMECDGKQKDPCFLNISDIGQSIITKQVAKCTSSQEKYMKAVQDTQTELNNMLTSDTSNMGASFAASSTICIMCLFVFAIVALGIFYAMTKG